MVAMATLSDAEITAGLSALPGWERDGDEIVKTFDCGTFPGAVAFVVRIGFFAEHADHHPDLDVRWKRVRVALTTHDAGGLTTKDLDLAREIEGIGG
jgi:4a-hydroxytetrahydrobiopterin dehydratase